MDGLDYNAQGMVITFHLLYNVSRCLILLPTIGPMARLCAWLLPEREEANGKAKPRHLDPTALTTPSLALANAARETLRLGDLIDNMLTAMLKKYCAASKRPSPRKCAASAMTSKRSTAQSSSTWRKCPAKT